MKSSVQNLSFTDTAPDNNSIEGAAKEEDEKCCCDNYNLLTGLLSAC